MKNLSPKILISLFFLITVLSCDKDDGDINQIDLLPEKTQIGANTFGCLVNGQAYVDRSNNFNYYQLVDGEYYLNIAGENSSDTFLRQIILGSNQRQVQQGFDYNLSCNEPNNFFGEVSFNELFLRSSTCSSNSGVLSITKLDIENNILSGTFEFDIVDPRDGSIIQIREGRFDTLLFF